MTELVVNKDGNSLFKDNKQLLIVFLIVLTVVLFLLLKPGLPPALILAVFSMPALFLVVFNYQLAIVLFFVSFFVNTHVLSFTPSELLGGLLLSSFLVTHIFDRSELKSPIVFPLFVFFLTMLPSFINSERIVTTLFSSTRMFIIFGGLVVLLPMSIKNYNWIKKLTDLFLFFCFLNAVHVIYLAISTGKRVFGFSGIMFVDYVSVGIIISFLSMIYRPKRRIFYFFVTVILLAGSVFTQTRNTWISCGATIMLIMIQFIRKSKDLGYNRKKVILIALALVLGLAGIVLLAVSFHPSSFNRLSTAGVDARANVNGFDMSSFGSLATRFFIWITAWNAFLAHPVVGVGLYNFPMVSAHYSTISPILFDTFVKGLSPHIAYLAVLSETGIVGMVGFLFFLFSIIKLGLQTIKKAKFGENYFYSAMLFWIQIYSFFSMAMSDAWMWGHGLMLWGITLTLLLANYRIVSKTSQLN